MASIYPEYLTDINVIFCPSDPNAKEGLDDGEFYVAGDESLGLDPCRFTENISYEYTGYAIWKGNSLCAGRGTEIVSQWGAGGDEGYAYLEPFGDQVS